MNRLATTDIDAVVQYHEQTKHHPNRYARSMGYLDWATQPDPFRRYEGAPLFRLPFQEMDVTPSYESLYRACVAPVAVNAESVGRFFEMSLAISAWKEYAGSRWALRCNPSSGNLHPTEGYLISGAIDGLRDAPGVYHYAAHEHGLEVRAEISTDTWKPIEESFPSHTFFVGLTSIFWREAWKYGERAFRYCQHDVGHAIAALSYAGAALGWRVVHFHALSDDDVSAALGVDRDEDFGDSEREHPDALFAVVPAGESSGIVASGERFRAISQSTWTGKANLLSADHVEWRVIDQAAEASRAYSGFAADDRGETPCLCADTNHDCNASARTIFLQRRSAVDMDGHTAISRETFYTMLARTLPRLDRPPWWTLGFRPAIHFGLFVHRVNGIEPGLYGFVRDARAMDGLRAAMDPKFLWERAPGAGDDFPLYGLAYGDCTRFAAQASCGQAIAGESAFSLGMIAEFEGTLAREGAAAYRRLFWEAGMAGQVLYLEAEAAGIRSTGIGCYFDDVVHDAFGLKGRAYQSMYHFTVGGPVDDGRLSTLPPYTAARRGTSGWE